MSTNKLPKHLGIVLDGNRRWAKSHGLTSVEGHKKGSEVFKQITFDAFEKGIQYISAFIFSTENWSRTEDEVKYLMSLVVKASEQYLDEYHEHGIKIVVLGRRDGLTDSVVNAIERTEEKTKNNTNGTLGLCFNYGGQDELVESTKQIIKKGVAPEDVTLQTISEHIFVPEIPPIDLLIRTSGEQRLSGFMLWRAAYAELLFTKTYWPDFTAEELDQHLDAYAKRQRRFGS